MTFTQLIARVTNTIADWTNRKEGEDNIKAYINEGYAEFANLTRCLVKHGNITITADTKTYSVPSDCISITRFSWDGRSLPVYSTYEMDSNLGEGWKDTGGTTIMNIVQDHEGYGTIRIYPYIDDADDIGGLVLGSNSSTYKCIVDHTSSSSTYPITGASYSTYWSATATDGTGDTWVTATNYTKYLNLELDYAYLPTSLSSGSDEPLIQSYYHPALADYAIAMFYNLERGVDREPAMGDRYYNRFLYYVNKCKIETERGFASTADFAVYQRPFA
jgi:hypothetical protein